MKLQDIGLETGTDKATYHEYLDFYEKVLPKSNFSGRLLEIGVLDGSSLLMWHKYYPKAEIIGIDIENRGLQLDGVTILQMDSKDIQALKELGEFDIIIDDGSHLTLDQQISFYWLYYNQLNKAGWYIIEDIHTSFRPDYVNSKYTTMEMLELLNLDVSQYRRSEDELDSMTTIIKAGQ